MLKNVKIIGRDLKMNLFKKVKTKLISAFLIVAILIGIVGLVGGISVKRVNKSATEMYEINLQSINKVLSIKSNMSEIKGELLTMMYEEDKSEVEKAKKNIDIIVGEDNKYIEDYEKLIVTSEEKKVWTEFKNNVTKYRDVKLGKPGAVLDLQGQLPDRGLSECKFSRVLKNGKAI